MSLIILLALWAKQLALPLGHEDFDVRQRHYQWLEKTRIGLLVAAFELPHSDPEIHRRLQRFEPYRWKFRMKVCLITFKATFSPAVHEDFLGFLPFPAAVEVEEVKKLVDEDPYTFYIAAQAAISSLDTNPQLKDQTHAFDLVSGDGNTSYVASVFLNRVAYVRLGHKKAKNDTKRNADKLR